ncbi:hypothetical protein ATC1_12226 [Flexilinea flocculi]|jgi:hypothetical protein|uniref:Uncharacterized protein n=1 Tax=Flexilinea flocculi TaxID=1678840 RepID=A0A0K8PAL0_9CHLR|nr:hypothetical protein ATC1_12226 [Flexilinea flocculi]
MNNDISSWDDSRFLSDKALIHLAGSPVQLPLYIHDSDVQVIPYF